MDIMQNAQNLRSTQNTQNMQNGSMMQGMQNTPNLQGMESTWNLPNLQNQTQDMMVQGMQDWSDEVQRYPIYSDQQGEPGSVPGSMQGYLQTSTDMGMGMGTPAHESLNFSTGLDSEALHTPVTAREVYLGSMKSLLSKNVGHYIVATFLVGTQSPISWEGLLHSVGNDYLVIYQPDQGRYVTGDLYSLKFVEFHNSAAGTIPPCVGARRRDAGQMW